MHGAATTQGRPVARINATGSVAFRSGDGVGALTATFRASIPSPSFPLSTLHWIPRSEPVQNSGPSGLLVLSREALSSSTPCRFIPAHHHIVFPPRLEVMVEKQYADGFPADSGNQSPLDGSFHHQPHSRASAALWRITANHGDDALLLAIVEYFGRSWPFLLVEGALQATLLVSVTGFTDASGVSGNTLEICGELAPLVRCSRARARSTTRTCCTPPLSRLASSCRCLGVTSILRGGRPIP